MRSPRRCTYRVQLRPGWGFAEAAAIVPRLVLDRGPWVDTTVTLPGGRWSDVLAGRRSAGGAVRVEALVSAFPVALLERE